jgi:hypothetical protein
MLNAESVVAIEERECFQIYIRVPQLENKTNQNAISANLLCIIHSRI